MKLRFIQTFGFVILLSFLFIQCEQEVLADDRRKAKKIAKKTFEEYYNIDIEPSLVYVDFYGHWVSTVYWKETRLRIYVDSKGVVSHGAFGKVLFPKGEQRVLCVIVNYKALGFEEHLQSWEAAQQAINAQHEAYAVSQGLTSPIVQFKNTNVFIDSAAVERPTLEDVRIAVQKKGIRVEDFDIVAFMDLNLDAPSGGRADYQTRFVKMGWFFGTIPNDTPELDSEKMKDIAYAVYHHEIGHVWGWEHEWSGIDTSDVFITKPILFGWEDVDGDRIPEILDETPYGIKK